MPIEFCLPTSGKAVPSGPDWLHEIKYDGYRLRVERHGDRVKLTSRSGLDWTRRFPWIVETARKIRKTQFVIDGEAVLLGVDGISDFNGLHSGEHNAEVQLYAFDMLAGDGDDMRKLPLSMRKTNLARLLRGRAEGIFVAGPKRCRSKAVAALVSERRTKRRGERAGTCWPPVLPKKCFAISVGRPTLNFGVARGECSVFSSPQGHGSGSPIGPSSFGAAQMP
jgi:bifunctional non-homologous end joining protein LigD